MQPGAKRWHFLKQPRSSADPSQTALEPSAEAYPANGSEFEEGIGVSGSRPRSVPGVTAGSGDGAGEIGATGFGRAIELAADGAGGVGLAGFGATFFAADFIGAAFFAAVFTGDDLLAALFFAAVFLDAAFFAFLAPLVLLAFFAGRAFFAMLFLAAARLVLACERFFPLPFFFAMVSLLLGVNPILMRVALKKSAVICARRWSRRYVLRTLRS